MKALFVCFISLFIFSVISAKSVKIAPRYHDSFRNFVTSRSAFINFCRYQKSHYLYHLKYIIILVYFEYHLCSLLSCNIFVQKMCSEHSRSRKQKEDRYKKPKKSSIEKFCWSVTFETQPVTQSDHSNGDKW